MSNWRVRPLGATASPRRRAGNCGHVSGLEWVQTAPAFALPAMLSVEVSSNRRDTTLSSAVVCGAPPASSRAAQWGARVFQRWSCPASSRESLQRESYRSSTRSANTLHHCAPSGRLVGGELAVAAITSSPCITAGRPDSAKCECGILSLPVKTQPPTTCGAEERGPRWAATPCAPLAGGESRRRLGCRVGDGCGGVR